MKYAKITDNVVVQVQPYLEDGFIEVDDSTFCGMIDNGDGAFTTPEPEVIPEDPKMVGVEFDGVMCSATKEDLWGLSSVKDWVAAGNNVNFEFDNGNVLTLTKDNYAAFEAVWIPFRAGFF